MSLLVFEKFLVDLHTELDRLEFQHYDPDNTVRDEHVGIAQVSIGAAEMSSCRGHNADCRHLLLRCQHWLVAMIVCSASC